MKMIMMATLATLLCGIWLHEKSRAQAPLRVYVQRARDKQWTDLQGTEIVGFACGPESRGNATDCYIATR